MIERALAALILTACAVLLVRLLIGTRRRYRFDAFVRRACARLRDIGYSAFRHVKARRESRRGAQEAIRRARGGVDRESVDREGNVYKPRSFRKPPRDKMH